MDRLSIDFVSDIVCPWCALGYYRLKQAADDLDVELDIRWHPFELNPSMPAKGQDLYEHFQEKYGMTPAKTDALGETLSKYAEPLDFTFNYPRGNRMRNTLKAHQLLAWTRTRDKETHLYEALFKAYFTLKKDIASNHELLEIATSVGLSRGGAESCLVNNEFLDQVKAWQREWQSKGLHAVPAVVFEDRYLLNGAQSIDVYQQQISKALDRLAVAN